MINLLVELRTEDIPCEEVKNIEKLLLDLKNNLMETFTFHGTNIYITHRRFTFIAQNAQINTKLHTTHIAKFTHDKNTENNIIKIVTENVTHRRLDDLHILVNNKCISLIHKNTNSIKLLYESILKTITESLKNYKTNNKMIWDTNFCSFSRPITQVIVKINKNCTYKNIFTLKCTNKTDRNRILNTNNKLKVCAKSYVKKLENYGLVIPSYLKRLELLRRKLLLVTKKNNIIVVNGKKTILENIMQTEYPNIGIESFNIEYLKIPMKLLEINIQNDQRCFILSKNIMMVLKISSTYIYPTNLLHNKQNNIGVKNTLNVEAKLQDTMLLLKYGHKEPEKLLHLTQNYVINTFTGTLVEQTKRILTIAILLPCKTINKNKAYIVTKLLLAGHLSSLVSEYPNYFNLSSGYLYKHYYGNSYNKFCKVYRALNTEITSFKTCYTILYVEIIYITDIICCYFINTLNTNLIHKDPLGLRIYIRNFSLTTLNHNLNINKTINTIFNVYNNAIDLRSTITDIIYICIKKKEQEYYKKINISQTTLLFKIVENIIKRISNLIKRSTFNIYKKTVLKQFCNRETYLTNAVHLHKKKIFLHLKTKNHKLIITNIVHNLRYIEYFLNIYNVINKTKKIEEHKRIILLKNSIELLLLITV